MARIDNRKNDQIRDIKITRNYTKYAEGSVLIEMGFVSNYEDAMALANSTDHDGIAQAIVDGIKEYVTRSGVSSY